MVVFWSGFFVVSVSFFFMVLFLWAGEKCGKGREKSSPYECGFEVIGSARSSFSVRFFLGAVLFVVFDLEVVLLMPLLYMYYFYKSLYGFICFWLFLFILFVGLFHEYREGSLDWVK